MTQATVLIVEDEAIVAADLAAKLGQLGYEVVGVATKGEDALAMASARRPQVVGGTRFQAAIEDEEAEEAADAGHGACGRSRRQARGHQRPDEASDPNRPPGSHFETAGGRERCHPADSRSRRIARRSLPPGNGHGRIRPGRHLHDPPGPGGRRSERFFFPPFQGPIDAPGVDLEAIALPK